ncbi:MAG: zinc-binding dehydrogenase [Acidimicrobiia bacterium]|nr:zinc-binding dehydrogenase [Acidimicrobiia bacterium]
MLVVGAGAAGILLAQAARSFGASSVVVCEPVASRRHVGEQLDLDAVFADIDAAVDAHPERFSLVVDTTGEAEVLAASFNATDTGGTLLVFGICAQGATVPVEPVKFYEREVQIVGSRGSNGTQGSAVELLASGRVRWEPLVDDRHSLDDLPHALGRLGRGEVMKAVTVSGGV